MLDTDEEGAADALVRIVEEKCGRLIEWRLLLRNCQAIIQKKKVELFETITQKYPLSRHFVAKKIGEGSRSTNKLFLCERGKKQLWKMKKRSLIDSVDEKMDNVGRDSAISVQ